MGQTNISGIIKDRKSKTPLPFATVITNTGIGTITDTEGRFNISSKNIFSALTITYVGYNKQNVIVPKQNNFITILLDASSENLGEVLIVAKENPALAIIRNTIKNRDKNNISKALQTFKYKLYNKLLVTANPDSISGTIDSVFVKKNDSLVFVALDSANYNFKKQINRHHLYITEKVAEHTFQRGKNKKETIFATRMAGFKTPIYEFLALDIESFSFYDEVYTLLGNNYINPLAKNALKKYNYKILDTIYNEQGASYMIHYKPKHNKDVAGLEGLLYIHEKSFALEKGIAELKGIVAVQAVQNFTYKNEENIWFPDETTISIRKGKNKEDVSIFGEVIKFSENETQNDSIVNPREKDFTDATYLISKSKIYDITINEPIRVINSASSIEIDDYAADRNEDFWNTYRTDSITSRGLEAYKVLDSLSESEGAEKKLNIARKVLKGYYPTKYFDLDLSKMINFNNYEGFRFGLGGVTNPTFSKIFQLETNAAYGFKDKTIKYHVGAAIRLSKTNNSWIGAGYTDDLQEAAKLDFLFEETSFALINPRNLNIGQFFNYKTFNINFKHDILPNLETKLEMSRGSYNPKFNYQFITNNLVYSEYNLTTATAALKWTPFSRYLNTPEGKFTIKNGFPKITVQFAKTFNDFLGGNLEFNQLKLKYEHDIKFLNKSSTNFLIQGGYTFGDAPLTHLYNATPNYSFANPWRKRINFSGTNAFETMAFNEFISDRYVSIQGRYNFDRFEITKKFRPSLSLISRFAIGSIESASEHYGVSFKKMNKGYMESGIVLNHLFKGFGVSSFYRYGQYSNAKFSDNLAVKLTYVLSLGF
ncbi:DUF5686 and carboxypeptidase-like regulatory domain-containing protein [Aureibaculum luteum]|uniref:DUF5686 and carboxypeptidase-like regulatory domain-containing protein n=1 Tax=Aureibaculum luteum TaxID=1548456 RepID=UPI00130018A0|nr:DUF5686 and carboxypeptidase-like regulatory domain-containing protein [Aureibaculum luteum]